MQVEGQPASGDVGSIRPALARPCLRIGGLFRQVALALVICALAVVARLALDPWLGTRQPYTLAFAAIALAAWLATWRAGAITAVIFQLQASSLVARDGLGHSLPADWAGIGNFYVIAALMLYLGHRAGTTSRMIEGLRKADQRKSEFLALLAHELRNPLATVHTGVELLKLGPPAETVRTTAGRMERQVAQMTRLIEDLLDIARIDQGKIKLQIETLPVEAAVAEAVSTSATFTAAKNQRVCIEVASDARLMEADPMRFTQVLTNLLHNASKFSPEGSTLHVCARPTPTHVVITVRDPGVGIAPDQLELIFDSFVQVNPGAHAGLGLGLALVRRLMEMQGGTAHARSDGPGKGSEFMLTFRRGPTSSATPEALRTEPPGEVRAEPKPEPHRAPVLEPIRVSDGDQGKPARRQRSPLVDSRVRLLATRRQSAGKAAHPP